MESFFTPFGCVLGRRGHAAHSALRGCDRISQLPQQEAHHHSSAVTAEEPFTSYLEMLQSGADAAGGLSSQRSCSGP